MKKMYRYHGSSTMASRLCSQLYLRRLGGRNCILINVDIFDKLYCSLQSINFGRLNKVMRNAARNRRMKVNIKDALKPWFVLMMLNTIVLVIWTKVDPLRWERIDTGVVDGFDRSIDSYGVCNSKNKVPYVVLLFLINLSLVLLANYQAYCARNLSTEFSESRYISIIMVSSPDKTCLTPF